MHLSMSRGGGERHRAGFWHFPKKLLENYLLAGKNVRSNITEILHPRKWFVVTGRNKNSNIPNPGQPDNSNALPPRQSDQSKSRPMPRLPLPFPPPRGLDIDRCIIWFSCVWKSSDSVGFHLLLNKHGKPGQITLSCEMAAILVQMKE